MNVNHARSQNQFWFFVTGFRAQIETADAFDSASMERFAMLVRPTMDLERNRALARRSVSQA